MERNFTTAQQYVLRQWARGVYALGWRGALARWIIEPAINSAIVTDPNASPSPSQENTLQEYKK